MSTLQQRRTTTTSSNIEPAPPNRTKKARRKKLKRSNVGTSPLLGIGIICLWILIPLYIMNRGVSFKGRSFFRQGDNPPSAPVQQQAVQQPVQPLQQQRPPPEQHETTAIKPKRANKQFVYRKLESELIDMRDMSATLAFEDKDGGVWKQGWDVIPKATSEAAPLKIFVVPHSHCDPGWIKTFDDYFRSQTSGIITSIVDALAKDPKRKFIWAEISYFEWWWREQSQEKQDLAKKLLRNGQLEFVTGGWVQPDEANTELYAMEVQLQEGHDWIRKNVGEEFIPKYGWSIDPFGYSPTMAYLLNKYGFEGMLIQRVHYAVKKELASKKQLEFMWRQTWDDTGEHDIFTHLMPFYSYDVPHTCGPDPSVCCQFDFARPGNYGGCPWKTNPVPITGSNVRERAMLLLDQHLKKASLYRGNAVLIPLGDDFRYRTSEEADRQFENYQAIFDYINKYVPGVEAQFGTLSDYFKEVIGTFDTPILKGAFFTYSDRAEDYWSGYFTSRVFDKALDRKLERVLYAAETLGATPQELQEPRRALSLFQHHDGVTGTAKTHVVEDYAKRMHQAIYTVQQWLLPKIIPNAEKGIDACWRSDAPRGMSQNLCGEAKDVHVYNPLSFPQKCGKVTVPPHKTMSVEYPCDSVHDETSSSKIQFKFDEDGLLKEPIQEQWMKWKVNAGGAYLFFPGTLADYNVKGAKNDQGGWVVSTPHWKRTIVQHEYSDEFGSSATVLDFIYETNLKEDNEEWFVRFTSNIQNGGVFHTDLNGFNFDTHHHREDMPIQSQVFPMPTLASIEDHNMRMSIISEHAQGTASLETGAIDVWLDRRLKQDDNRGLAQPIRDNVPTRTRLRVVLEKDFPSAKEFDITPLCRRMWDELNHPLEAFGKQKYQNVEEAHADMGDHDMIGNRGKAATKDGDKQTEAKQAEKGFWGLGGWGVEPAKNQTPPATQPSPATLGDDSTPIVPIVLMVFKRVDYLKQCIDSIRNSDVDKKRVPIVISQDGNVPEMTEYVESLKDEFLIHRVVHPYSCFEHPDDFPGDSQGTLNKNYKGDAYKNPRDGKVTCCKHHFTWIMKTVYSDLTFDGAQVDHFFFMEEDYIVAPNIYESIVRGLGFLEQTRAPDGQDMFGLLLDPTNGNSSPVINYPKSGFIRATFVTGPMVMSKTIIGEIIKKAKEYCEFDDYNWDWSIVHLQGLKELPNMCLVPTQPQVKHIGVDGGMHKMDDKKQMRMKSVQFGNDFHATMLLDRKGALPKYKDRKGYGGWGHPADQNHCKKLLGA